MSLATPCDCLLITLLCALAQTLAYSSELPLPMPVQCDDIEDGARVGVIAIQRGQVTMVSAGSVANSHRNINSGPHPNADSKLDPICNPNPNPRVGVIATQRSRITMVRAQLYSSSPGSRVHQSQTRMFEVATRHGLGNVPPAARPDAVTRKGVSA